MLGKGNSVINGVIKFVGREEIFTGRAATHFRVRGISFLIFVVV
jgi:hypothetical protein